MSAVLKEDPVPRRPRRCLVLNADGRLLSTWPPSIISAQDAVHAWCRDRVTVVETWPDEFYHSPSTKIAVPKIVMLRDYAPVSGTVKFCRRSVILRDRSTCQYCGEKFPSDQLTFDHVLARSRGGVTSWGNIVMACLKCNAAKGSQDANHSGRKKAGDWRPLKPPKRPTTAELLRAGLELLPKDIIEDFGSLGYWSVPLEP